MYHEIVYRWLVFDINIAIDTFQADQTFTLRIWVLYAVSACSDATLLDAKVVETHRRRREDERLDFNDRKPKTRKGR